MKQFVFLFLFLMGFSTSLISQGVSCPAVVASPDTVILCSSPCFNVSASPVSGFQTTTYNTQQIAYNPFPYNAGTAILQGVDDTWSSVIPIGFTFCFFGQNYTQLLIGSNGIITFDLTPAGGYCQFPINNPIPSNQNPMNSIMGPYHDIDPSVAGTIRWISQGTAPCRVFIASFENVAMFDCNSLIATHQIVLYETTNVIETYILNKPVCTTWNSGAAIQGIQNATGTVATFVPNRNYPTQWTAANDAWAFVPAGPQNYAVTWYEAGNPTPISTNNITQVCPTASTEYYAEVVYTNCDNSTVTVRDTATITINGNSNIVVTTSSTDVTCPGATDGTATASAAGPGPWFYQWNTTPPISWPTITNLAAGTYTVTVSDINGCNVVQQVTVGTPPPLVANPTSTDVTCAGDANGTASVTVSGGTPGYTYDWGSGPAGPTVNNLAGGNYTLTITDAQGCQITRNIVINEPQPLTAAVLGSDALCANGASGSVTATAGGGTPPYGYTWSTGPGGQTISNLLAGTYTVSITDAHGCFATATTTIGAPSPMVANISGIAEICDGEEAPLTSTVSGGTPPYTYHWVSMPNSISETTPNIAPTPHLSSTYALQIKDANNCTITVTHDVVVHPRPVIEFAPSVREGCDTLIVQFINNTQFGATYLWEFGDGSTSTQIAPAHTYLTGIFDVKLTVTSPAGCVRTQTAWALISVIPSPQASFVTDPKIDNIDHLLISEANVLFTQTSIYANAHYYDFSNGDTLQGGTVNYIFPDSGLYTITLTSLNRLGCFDQAVKTLRVLLEPFLWVPNAFSPNGDQVNDRFEVQGLMVTEYEIFIFDRWGKTIFHGNSLDESWDGNFGGQPVQEGTYIYRINAKVNTGQKVQRGGSIILIH